mgnify:CR=1 FL=1
MAESGRIGGDSLQYLPGRRRKAEEYLSGGGKKGMQKRLSDRVADDILTMITIEKRFLPGDKIPNELELSKELGISRTTLREAFRILAAGGVLEIRRGLGTFVREDFKTDKKGISSLSGLRTDIRDLYEMRLIVEPEAAYYAAERADEEEMEQILRLGRRIEEEIAAGKDRTEAERNFHKAIARASHNEFMTKLMPVIYQAVDKGVRLSGHKGKAVSDTVRDHRMIMEFLRLRNAEGARSAMKIHILHAMEEFEL